MRHSLKKAPALFEQSTQLPDGWVQEVRHYKLITPMFGGGAQPRRADDDLVVRGSAVRGQLRFWWRATRGGNYDGHLKKMWQAEAEIWGSASHKDQTSSGNTVQLHIKVIEEGSRVYPFSDKYPNGEDKIAPAYVAFPLNKTKTDPTYYPVRKEVQFELYLRYPARWQGEVHAALWAWETFGGVGGRTRRGFGALHLLSINGQPHSIQDAKDYLKQGLATHVSTGPWPQNVAYLSRQDSHYKITPDKNWQKLIQALKEFRQDRRKGPNPKRPGPNRPGRSYWPEPDAIRRALNNGRYVGAKGTNKKGESVDHSQPVSHIDCFPRAAFGMPIITHFKDTSRELQSRDPKDTTLKPKDYERLASPLILRPLLVQGKEVGLAAILEGFRQLPEVVLVSESKPEIVVRTRLRPSEAQDISKLNGQTDVLLAFMQYL